MNPILAVILVDGPIPENVLDGIHYAPRVIDLSPGRTDRPSFGAVGRGKVVPAPPNGRITVRSDRGSHTIVWGDGGIPKGDSLEVGAQMSSIVYIADKRNKTNGFGGDKVTVVSGEGGYLRLFPDGRVEAHCGRAGARWRPAKPPSHTPAASPQSPAESATPALPDIRPD